MKEYIGLFVDYLRYERNYSSYTVDSYVNDLRKFIDFIDTKATARGDSIFIDMIDSTIVREWMMFLMKQSLTPSSVNRKLSALQSFFKFLVCKGILNKHPIILVSGPKKSKPLPYFVKEKAMDEILDDNKWCSIDYDNIRDKLIIELLYETGVRRSELIGIKNSDVDMDSMSLKVTGKRNKQRIIPFAERLKGMMQQYINVRKKTVKGRSLYFFLRKNGKQLSPAIVYYIVKKRLSNIHTLAKYSPHVLRHTFATSMLNNGAEIEAVKDLLGHSSLASTSVYTHVTFEELKKMYHAHPRAKNKED